MINKLTLSLFSILFCTLSSSQEISINIPIQLNALFSDHMVLQQSANVSFWGTSTPNETLSVTGSWGGKSNTIVDTKGHWNLNLETPEAGGPFIVDIETKFHKKSLVDVMIGEVWLASGQSNMEMPLKGWPPNDVIDNSEEEIQKSDYAEVRMFTVQKQLSLNPIGTFKGSWKVSSPETSGEFSASAYFFARRLHKALKVPVGIIHSSWGGTPVEAWTSNQVINEIGDFDDILKDFNDISDQKETSDWFSKWKSIAIPEGDKQWDQLVVYDSEFKQVDYDDSQWNQVYLPGQFDAITQVDFDGVMWFRKTVHIRDLRSDYTLEIEAIDDMDIIYVNGNKVGGFAGTNYSNSKRTYKVPKRFLNKGANTIAIRAIDVGGPGTFKGPMLLSSDSGFKISLTGYWSYRMAAEIYKGKLYLYGVEYLNVKDKSAIFKINPKLPTVLFNAMIHPLIPYTIKGSIWYQGEENVGRAEQYKQLFPAMISDWRERWNYDFPFYFVQIAPFQYPKEKKTALDQSQKLREAQRCTLNTKNTGMVVTMDIGNFNNIHPSNKQAVGKRLAGLALVNEYGKQLVASGPLFKSIKRRGEILVVNFDEIGSGLISKGALRGFEIAGLDMIYKIADANIINNTIELSASTVSNPKYARYGWSDQAIPCLFNLEGLPASSFTSE
ncbi:sialate O-acetylesterase [Flavobacteriaceae bacterium]|nr:sialate O-acetylesterase [Flavobacteriaceae bacterium]